jgi:hypothetical protein
MNQEHEMRDNREKQLEIEQRELTSELIELLKGLKINY